MVQINGETRENYENLTVEEMVDREGLQKSRVAVEINGEIVSKQKYNDLSLIHI